MITRRTTLSHNIVAFCRFLRENGMAIGPDEESTALQALGQVDLADRDAFWLALRTVLCRRVQDLEPFDRLFRQYWKELEKAVDSKIKDDPKKQRQKPKPGPDFNQLKSWLYGNKPSEETELTTYSVQENLSQKDFSVIAADDLAEVMQRIRELSLTMARRANRRYRKTSAARQFDLPQTLRKNLRRGGELLEVAYRRPRKNHLNVVILADVSQSMDLYSTFLIQFLYAFQTVYRRIETFVFSTSLHRITPALRNRPFAEALSELSDSVSGWGGGTRIGASLQQFADEYLNLVDRHTLVIILSDGWDTGDVDVLTESLTRIKQKARKIVWLNPLAGNPSFQPNVAGMQAALPLLDGFAPVHNVESLRALDAWL
ncbi:VWA domain-containing protein [Rudanella paleaurantiibacter]|uniref:VWA domain-containing protein n=1 Tax=Rudanella paleaurantiibacter TaxID=2614655 RepID=A0A7J5U1L5_9BACT|nr:VWA domain-containing protein [Rudanella paleaurantiibacter]KAB7731600.1 VWA domain-containing protein [Rudanella paleaurantiibacter]